MNEPQKQSTDWLALGRSYLALNAAESGADVIIAGLCDEVEWLRAETKALNEAVATNTFYDQRDAYFEGRRDERNGQ